MSNAREKGRAIVREMLGDSFVAGVEKMADAGGVGARMASRMLEDAYGYYWADPRLDRRSRSLVTLGILIALRAGSEIKNHVRGALANGVTPQEIEALMEHAVCYVGYPAAGAALAAAREVLSGQGFDMTFSGSKPE